MRASLYRLLALAFDYPRQELFEAVQSGELRDILFTIVTALRMPCSGLPVIGCNYHELEAEYLAMFEAVGSGETRCSLQERTYSDREQEVPLPDECGGRGALWEDLLRFYHHFGLKLAEDPSHRLPPDHLVCQLEMLSYLSIRESRANGLDSSAASYRNAQRDFLRRHVSLWLPQMVRRLRQYRSSSDAGQFYEATAELALASVMAHLDRYS